MKRFEKGLLSAPAPDVEGPSLNRRLGVDVGYT